MIKIKGIGVSGGVGIGKVLVLRKDELSVPKRRISHDEISREIYHLEEALMETRREISDLQKKISNEIGFEHSRIFEAHYLVLEDRVLIEDVIKQIKIKKVNVEYAFSESIKKYVDTLLKLKDEYLRERVVDIEDISRRVLRTMLKEKTLSLSDLKEKVVIVSHDLGPSQTASLPKENILGFVTDVGGATARFDNFVVDAIDVGDGLTFQGTTTTNELFAEALLQDEATAIGVLSKTQNKIFSQGSAELSGTSLISIGESLTFADTVGGAYTYNLDITGGVDFTNTSIDASGLVDFNFDTSAATSFTMNGGGLASFKTFIT